MMISKISKHFQQKLDPEFRAGVRERHSRRRHDV